MNIDDYKDLFLESKVSKIPIEGLCGRILRGKTPEDFATLTDDPERKIIMTNNEKIFDLLYENGLAWEANKVPLYATLNEGTSKENVVVSPPSTNN